MSVSRLLAAALAATILSLASCAKAPPPAATSAATQAAVAHTASSPPASPAAAACHQFNAIAPRLDALPATAFHDPLAAAPKSPNEIPSQMPKPARALFRYANMLGSSMWAAV